VADDTYLSDARLAALLRRAELPAAKTVTRLPGGRNNRVFHVETNAGAVVLKAYFHHPNDPRDRLGAEFGFSQFAWRHGIRAIPRPLAADPDAHLGLYAYVNGTPPSTVDADAVTQAMHFVRALDAYRDEGLELPDASEACFSVQDHLLRVEARVANLARVEHERVSAYVAETLAPAWHSVQQAVGKTARRVGIAPGAYQAARDRCISPSDFGFHNALLDATGRYWFMDFEYAGWDDPAKLVCDFFCQQARPVPHEYFDSVAAEVTRWTSDPDYQTQRIRLLWPAYQVKWACIMLNEFLPISRERRQFAGANASEVQRRLERSGALVRSALTDTEQLAEVTSCSA
jgi:hypothetical protein